MSDDIKFYNTLLSQLNKHKEQKKSLTDNDIKQDIRVRLPVYRAKNNGMTQQELAEKLGVTVRQVIRWEKGESRPTDKILEKLKEIGAT